MIELSKLTRTSRSTGRLTPIGRSTAITERHIPATAFSSSYSCRRMFRISALLSLETSVAVFTRPAPSKSK